MVLFHAMPGGISNLLRLLVVATAASACGRMPAEHAPSAEQRFARESACDPADVVVQDLGAGAYRVSGCGSWARYACVTTGGVVPPAAPHASISGHYGASYGFGSPGIDSPWVPQAPTVQFGFTNAANLDGPWGQTTCIREDGGREAGWAGDRRPGEPEVRHDSSRGVSIVQTQLEVAQYRLILIAAPAVDAGRALAAWFPPSHVVDRQCGPLTLRLDDAEQILPYSAEDDPTDVTTARFDMPAAGLDALRTATRATFVWCDTPITLRWDQLATLQKFATKVAELAAGVSVEPAAAGDASSDTPDASDSSGDDGAAPP